MAEESDLEKTEAASPRRLDKAREEGQVPRSRELGTFAVLVAGLAYLWLGAPLLYRGMAGILHSGLGFDSRIPRDTTVMISTAVQSVGEAMLVLAPFFVVVAVVSVAAQLAIGGLVWSNKPLEVNLGKLDPIAGFGRIFSWNTVVELAKTVLKAGIVGGIGAVAIWRHHDDMIALMHTTPVVGLMGMLKIVATCSAFIIGSMILLVLADVPWQIFSHMKKLRMSKDDVKKEFKESEGDPLLKARMRQQQRQAASRRMMANIPSADVVVTNPTHYAVALKYVEGDGAAPRVIAKGMGLIAAHIREIAQENRVPMLEAPPLARALYKHVEVGKEIPIALYTAVAEVLAWVFQLRAWRPGWVQPSPPTDLPVPSKLDPQAQAAAEGV
ncbi:flagellar biosynthesis protein FlhB [Bordetella sp. LUAb4]|uniref:flagellar biosynthesis protein FlhB n=1 Tax=Bordetella sp. LUAb4 TaxID=2843195 RepID=UPI001E39589C|nr:flagellar biosynthesis protein FlhB [Bordetella sp. LUAb4]